MDLDYIKIGKAAGVATLIGAGGSLLLATNPWYLFGGLALAKDTILTCAGLGAISGGVSAAFGPSIEQIVREASRQIVENAKTAIEQAKKNQPIQANQTQTNVSQPNQTQPNVTQVNQTQTNDAQPNGTQTS